MIDRFRTWLGKVWCRLAHRMWNQLVHNEACIRVIWHDRLGLIVMCRRCRRLYP